MTEEPANVVLSQDTNNLDPRASPTWPLDESFRRLDTLEEMLKVSEKREVHLSQDPRKDSGYFSESIDSDVSKDVEDPSRAGGVDKADFSDEALEGGDEVEGTKYGQSSE